MKTRVWRLFIGFAMAGCVLTFAAQTFAQTPLTITCPSNVTVWTCTTNPVRVTFPSPTAAGSCASSAVITCNPASESSFPLGTSTVVCTATDNCRETATCTFTIAVLRDLTPPMLECPANITRFVCGTNPVPVSYPAPKASDDHSQTVAVTCIPASGSLFPIGPSTVSCTATDDCNNHSTCTFTITVNGDGMPPTIECPSSYTISACGTNAVPVSFPPPRASDDYSRIVMVTCSPPSGSLFPVGSTVVTCEATDDCTNRSRCTFTVTVEGDNNPPEITCPSNIVVWTCSSTGTRVNYPAPTAMDDHDRSPMVVCNPPPGSLFPPGITVVECSATDDCTNRSGCTFTVELRIDDIPPTIECPNDISRPTCSIDGAVITFNPPEVSDASGPEPSISCTPPSGSLFPLGTNIVHCVAIDACSNLSERTFQVIIWRDTTPPTIHCPTNIVVDSCDPFGVKVSYDDPFVSDNWISHPYPTFSCQPPSGSIFPVGTTTVDCVATDKCGNESQCSFKVTVRFNVGLPGLDLDQDELPDIWQIHFETGPLSPTGDSDADGLNNADEAVTGTDPQNAARTFESRLLWMPTGAITVSWPGVAGKLYQIHAAPSLGPDAVWVDLGYPVMARGGLASVTIEGTNLPPSLRPQAFFRISVRDVDLDGDGLTAWEESVVGTSDLSPNTYGDRGGDAGVAHQFADSFGIIPGRLREVAAAHVGGDPGGPTMTKLMTGAGTGGFFKLSTWTVDGGNQPVHLQDTASIEGHHVKLHTLTPPTSPTLTLNLVVNGRIRQDQNLFLTIYRVDQNGVFAALDTLGFGLSSSAFVRDYAIAHRALAGSGIGSVESFQVVTPIIALSTGGEVHVRVVTWRVNPLTGDLIATYDTGNLGHTNVPPDGGFLQIKHLDGDMYVVSYSNTKSLLAQWFFAVNNAGVVSPRGGEISGLPIRGGTNILQVGANQFALESLNPRGFMTGLIGTDCAMTLQVWDEQIVAHDPAPYSRPFYITDNTLDLNPNGHGILLDPPTVTDSREENFEENDLFGCSLAVGDFDGDGYEDVAIGVCGENDDAGEVAVMYGSATGLAGTSKDQHWRQGTDGLQGLSEANDRFGLALAAGDFNGDGRDDLAVGAPHENIEGESLYGVGVVHVIYGTPDGLRANGNQLWMQGSDGLPGTRQDYDWFGSALAAGDFNGDGTNDLAIGIPREEVDSLIAGAVQIIYGSASGLSATAGPGNQLLHQNSPSMIGDADEFDFFGRSLAAGDFDGSGHDDLAVGIPRQHVNDAVDAGAVQVIYGSNNGLGPDNHWFSQENFFPGGANIPGTQEHYDQFGSDLAAGDFNGDGRDDLAVGTPNEDDDLSGVEDSGAVNVLYGTGNGLTPTDSQLITQNGFLFNGPDIESSPEEFDYFGGGLAAADFNGDGTIDLAIGAAQESVQGNTIYAAGAVHVLYGGMDGLAETGNQLYTQGTADDDIRDQSEDGDFFGAALAAGDVNGDGTNDLVIGIPFEDLDDKATDAGAIQVIWAGGSGLGVADEFESQGTQRKVRALLTDVQWEEDYGVGQGALFLKMPPGEPPTNHVASVTKVMTLLLAVEALAQQNSPYSLDDEVTISQLAADTPGSRMGLTTGYPPLATNDVMPLQLLLYGMMMESCNKSSVAIAQHFTGEDDSYDAFVDVMNAKAALLGMTQSLYTHPAGGCITTPQDLVTLWRYGWQYQLFREFAGRKIPYYDCGVDAEEQEKCYDVQKFSDSGYPGLEGWKGGNGGLGPQLGVPWCTEAVLRQATRLDRSLVVALSQTANQESDGDNLFDYGYRLLFTPDFRGGYQMNSPVVRDFAVRDITDTLSFTALIDSQNMLRVHTWQVVAGLGQIAPLGATALTFNDIAGGTNSIPATLLDMTRLPTVEAEADYLTGHLENGRLRLDVWRVGAEPGS